MSDITTIINNLLNNGKAINDKLQTKLVSLTQTNNTFNGELTNKLQEILEKINVFKTSIVPGLTESKQKITILTNELQQTKDLLQKTNGDLDKIRQDIISKQNELDSATAQKTQLQQQVEELNNKITRLETEYQNNIASVHRDKAEQTTQEKRAMQEEHEKELSVLKGEHQDLQKIGRAHV